MADEQRTAKAQPLRPVDRAKLISYLEAAAPEVDAYDSTSGFLLRLAIHSLRKGDDFSSEETPPRAPR
jgi:hypothetical protein